MVLSLSTRCWLALLPQKRTDRPRLFSQCVGHRPLLTQRPMDRPSPPQCVGHHAVQLPSRDLRAADVLGAVHGQPADGQSRLEGGDLHGAVHPHAPPRRSSQDRHRLRLLGTSPTPDPKAVMHMGCCGSTWQQCRNAQWVAATHAMHNGLRRCTRCTMGCCDAAYSPAAPLLTRFRVRVLHGRTAPSSISWSSMATRACASSQARRQSPRSSRSTCAAASSSRMRDSTGKSSVLTWLRWSTSRGRCRDGGENERERERAPPPVLASSPPRASVYGRPTRTPTPSRAKSARRSRCSSRTRTG
jgi:hypothetical protein